MILVDSTTYVYFFKDKTIRYWVSKHYTNWGDYGKTWDWKIEKSIDVFPVSPSILVQWSKEDD